MSHWTDQIAGDRMAVDKEFDSQVRASAFSSQEWGLVMTAVEFEIEHPGDPEQARVVADTTQVPQIIPELENVRSQMGGPGGGGGSGTDGGVVDSLKGVLGLGDGDDEDRLEDAERLADEYARALQERLEDRGKWERIRTGYDG
ncbi:MAG: hypothetical protein A07HB70_00608 [uncultured archaeon A07HB70]|jgi:hypothetical protein|nr:MAG: hypothetical protein A07HB70_00608 [uncultured archaeon A07HB70]